jgi:Family of unknown function (DUF6448)
MSTRTLRRCSVLCVLACLTLLIIPSPVNAHCDTMNGPVVTAAKKALETGNVNFVLIWVKKNDEAEIKMAFEKTLAVRKLGSEAKNLADMYFFETLVRIHRAGEGVPYTGLKPVETVVDPGIAAADRSLETGSAEQLLKHLNEAVRNGIHQKFEQAMTKKKFKTDNVGAGREYVEAYVQFIHYVERLFQAVSKPEAGHLHDVE